MNDFLKLQGIFEQGYGVIPKKVMRDNELSIESKAIYGYISSFAGAGSTAFPSAELICSDLAITPHRFYKHRKYLEKKGYIKVHKQRNGARREKNLYEIVVNPVENEHVENEHVENEHVENEHVENEHVENEHVENEHVENRHSNNNNLNNNNLNNNKDKKSSSSVFHFYQQNFGVINPFMAESIEHWIKDTSEELVLAAMQRALKQQKQWKYAEGILKTWVNKNILTLDAVEAVEKEYGRKNEKGATKNGTNRGSNKTNDGQMEPRRETPAEKWLREFRENGGKVGDTECDF